MTRNNVSFKYESDLSPKISQYQSNKAHKLYSGHVILFLLLSSELLDTATSVFIKTGRKKKIVLLRAPYRYKLGRLQLVNFFYTTVVSCSFFTTNIPIFSKSFCKQNPVGISGGIMNLKKINTNFTVSFKMNFLMSNFNSIIVFNIF